MYFEVWGTMEFLDLMLLSLLGWFNTDTPSGGLSQVSVRTVLAGSKDVSM